MLRKTDAGRILQRLLLSILKRLLLVAFQYAEENGCWEDIAFHIIGDPDYSDARAEVYHAIMEAAKKNFEVKLLGTY
jgi:hypothetical protein